MPPSRLLAPLFVTLALAAAAPMRAETAVDLPADGPLAIGEELEVERIAPGAYRVVHLRPWPANSLLVEMPDGTLVLCDTPYDDLATRALLDWIRAAFGPRRLVVINGHFHADALGGNGALLADGAEIHGSDLTVRTLAERGEAVRRQLLENLADEELRERFRQAVWLPPQRVFPHEQGLELELGGERVVVSYPGAAHSPDNVVTWFPERRILFGGCLVRTRPRLVNVADSDLASYPRAVDALRGLRADIVVPGHGSPGGVELLDVTVRAVENYVADDQR